MRVSSVPLPEFHTFSYNLCLWGALDASFGGAVEVGFGLAGIHFHCRMKAVSGDVLKLQMEKDLGIH